MATDITTPLAVAERYREERLRVLSVQATDGPVVSLAKWFANCPILHGPIECVIRFCLNRRGIGKQTMANDQAEDYFRSAVEWYWLLWTVIVAGCYVGVVGILAGGTAAETNWPATLAMVALVGVGVFRLSEILATSIRLHFAKHYEVTNVAHALSLTFLAFFQAAVAFSILYCGSAFWSGDKFGSCGGLAASWVDPLYFSVVTLATLGYGDLKPELWSGRLLVIAELFFGLLLLVVAFQRVLGSIKPRNNNGGN